jgi:hypothetical protein
MAKRNIYEGPSSCYARNEGIYVPDGGVNLQTATGIAYLIMRDFQRGWTYDHDCSKIPMTFGLAVQRLRYLIPLATKHYGEAEAEKVRELVDYILEYGELPPWVSPRIEYVKRPVAIPISVEA